MTDLKKAQRLLNGAKIVEVELGTSDAGGGVTLMLDNGVILWAGARDENDEEGAVNGYAALEIYHKGKTFRLGTQGV